MNLVYHIYPLGACGAPLHNDESLEVRYRLSRLEAWVGHMRALQVDTVYLGPVWESQSHGYDTLDFYQVDRRLGDRDTLRNLVHAFHQAGMKVVLDGVFNHVGRGFFAFQDVLHKREQSPYAGWFAGLDFNHDNAYGDGLCYKDWSGCQDLVKLDGSHPGVQAYLLGAVEDWIGHMGIDGLRLDAADDLHPDFVRALRRRCDHLHPGFWLMGEMVHGDYRLLLGKDMLHSVTNYELYKALWSSLNDGNLHELAYAVQRQHAPSSGLYREHLLYTFVDNHDVTRAASVLKDAAHLPLLYCLLACLPGIPSLYYGSEGGIPGLRQPHSDHELRPGITLDQLREASQTPLFGYLRWLFALRSQSPALSAGDTWTVKVESRQYAFVRQGGGETLLVAVNADVLPARLRLALPLAVPENAVARDLQDSGWERSYRGRELEVELPARGGRIFSLG